MKLPTDPAALDAALLSLYTATIKTLGGEVTVTERSTTKPLVLIDRSVTTALLKVQGWRFYSSRFGSRFQHFTYLAGLESNEVWVHRVASDAASIDEAWDALTPAEVTNALRKGRRRVITPRVFAVETQPARDGGGELPEAYVFDAATRTLRVRSTGALVATLSFPVTFVRPKAILLDGLGGGDAEVLHRTPSGRG